MNRRPLTLIATLVAVSVLIVGGVAVSSALRQGVAQNPRPVTPSQPAPTHMVAEGSLASDADARTFALENSVALATWVKLPQGDLFKVAPSREITVTALGEGNKPSWVGTWTVNITSTEVPAFAQRYTQSMVFGPGAAEAAGGFGPHPRESGGLWDPALYLRIGALVQPQRLALLRLIAQRGNPALQGFDVLSTNLATATGLTDAERFYRDRLLATGVARGFAPTRIVWLSFDDPNSSDGTPVSLLVGYSAKKRAWIPLATTHGRYEGKLAAIK
jgi:hypothetical protein